MSPGTAVSFANLVAGLAATGLAALQQVEQALTGTTDAADNEPALDPAQGLASVKHLVDTLAMLEQKTQGNLEAAEAQVLQNALTELRIGYVKLADKVKAARPT